MRDVSECWIERGVAVLLTFILPVDYVVLALENTPNYSQCSGLKGECLCLLLKLPTHTQVILQEPGLCYSKWAKPTRCSNFDG